MRVLAALLAGCLATGCQARAFEPSAHRIGSTVVTTVPPYSPMSSAFGNGTTINFDPANSTGCASDSNNGQATCGSGAGLGPLKTYAGIVARWGSLTPYLPAAHTTIVQLSNHTDTSDPVILRPILGQTTGGITQTVSSVLTYSCPLPAPNKTGVLGTVGTTKARATNTVWGFPLASFTNQSDDFIVDSTANANFWLWKRSGANVFITQPIRTAVDWGFTSSPIEVTPVAGDTINEYAPSSFVQAHIVYAQPSIAYLSNSEISYVEITNCNIWKTGADLGDDNLFVGPYVWIHDTYIQKAITLDAVNLNNGNGSWSNNEIHAPFNGGYRANDATEGTTFSMWGGIIYSTAPGSHFNGIILTGDIMLQANAGGANYWFDGYNSLDAVWSDSANVFLRYGTLDLSTSTLSGPFFWGSGGTFNVINGSVRIASGAGVGAATFLASGGIKWAHGTTTACVTQPGAATRGACNLAAATGANIDTQLGATQGCVVQDGAGSICNMNYP